ncbi:MAG: cupin domain-containing protein [Anaerolineales bacterium]
MHPKVKSLIDHYKFQPLPAEGTLFVSTYRSEQEFDGSKPFGTAIIAMYCDEPRSMSLFHRLPVDEIWHFYGGDPLRLILLYPSGASRDVIMGPDVTKGQLVQFVVPAGVWQAGAMVKGGVYSLFGCTMAPGFTDDMFEGGTQEQLLKLYPDRRDDIRELGISTGETSMPKGFAS